MSEIMAADSLKAIIARLEAADYGIVMVAPGYSRAELVADLQAVLATLDGGSPKDARAAGERDDA